MNATRTLIAGCPRVGKTWLSCKLGKERGVQPLHTDDLIAGYAWSEASALVAEWIGAAGPWIIEGVAVPRALRKWLATHPDPKDTPASEIYWRSMPREQLTRGQATMAKGCVTVWNEVLPELVERGVRIRSF